MCGRFSLTADLGELARRFEFDGNRLGPGTQLQRRPHPDILTVVGGENRRGGFMRWGLIPHWAKSISIGNRMINARAETVAQRQAFRDAFRRRRCLVLADGFYEWQRAGVSRNPSVLSGSRGTLRLRRAVAVWKDPDGNTVPSCTIITTEANDLLRPIHHRMPVILPRQMEEFWLDRDVQDTAALEDALKADPPELMQTYQVSTLVNSPRNNGPQVLEPVT